MESLVDLHERFVQAARELMVTRGWESDPDAEISLNGVTLGEFTRPLENGFVGRVEFALESSFNGATRDGVDLRPAFLKVSLEIGLNHAPADRLQRFLGSETSSLCMVDVRDLTDPGAAETANMSDTAAVEHGVRQLTAALDQTGIAFLHRHANPDTFIALCQRVNPAWERFVRPAVLGVSGRTSDAQRSLDQAAGGRKRKNEPDGLRAYSERLREWLQTGSPVPDDPASGTEGNWSLPPADPEDYEPIDRSDRSPERRAQTAKTAIIRLIRSAGTDLSRAQRREILVREAAARSIRPDPIWTETTLDLLDLNLTPGQALMETGATIFGAGRSLFSALRGPDPAERSTADGEPEWMSAPENTWGRTVHHVDHTVAIKLDNGAHEFLTRVFESRPTADSKIIRQTTVDVWLAWDPAPRDTHSVLAVHIGPQRVGTVPELESAAYVPIIDSVQTVDMWPRIQADFARLASGTFILQIPVPA